MSYLTFWKFESILASHCVPIEVGVVPIIMCKCGWIPKVAKRNVGPLWQVASGEVPVGRIIVGTCRGRRLLQTVMYSHFGGYDTLVNRKSPVIRFFLKFSWAHSNQRAYGSRWLCCQWSLAGAAGGWLTQIVMYGPFEEWRKLQLIVNHLKSGVFQHSDFLHNPKVTHMTINSDGCASYYPWHVPRPHGGQRKTGAITRSYLTLWKLQHIVVTQCLLIDGGDFPCEFIDIFSGQKPRRVWLLKFSMVYRMFM